MHYEDVEESELELNVLLWKTAKSFDYANKREGT